MSLIATLRDLGSRLGLMQVERAAAPAAPARIATRTLTLDELQLAVPDPARLAALAVARCAAPPSDLALPFAAIDEAAGVAVPAHGWSVEQVAAFLARPELAGATRELAQGALLTALQAAGAPPADVVRDACARDQALDGFAQAAHAELARRRGRRRARAEQIAVARAALDAEAAALDAQDHDDAARWQAWWQAKLARERALAAAAGMVLDLPLPSGVTVDADLPPIP
jgi:hypothetical protein